MVGVIMYFGISVGTFYDIINQFVCAEGVVYNTVYLLSEDASEMVHCCGTIQIIYICVAGVVVVDQS